MPKGRARYRLEELRAKRAAKHGDTVEFEIGGEEFAVAAPGFWPDDAKRAMRRDDDLAFAEALLGDEYGRFAAAGGRSDDLALLLEEYAHEQGLTPGESARSRS